MTVQLEGIKISELFTCPPEEQNLQVDQLLQAALHPTKAQQRQQQEKIDCRIKKFEGRYEMSSSTMRQKLSQGQIKETADICSWLMLLKARENEEVDT